MEALEADTYRPFCPPEFTFDKLYLTTFISHSIMLGRFKKKRKEPSFTFYFRFLNDLIQVALHIISVKIFSFFFWCTGKRNILPCFHFWRFLVQFMWHEDLLPGRQVCSAWIRRRSGTNDREYGGTHFGYGIFNSLQLCDDQV